MRRLDDVSAWIARHSRRAPIFLRHSGWSSGGNVGSAVVAELAVTVPLQVPIDRLEQEAGVVTEVEPLQNVADEPVAAGHDRDAVRAVQQWP
jgi:hypothetical protein